MNRAEIAEINPDAEMPDGFDSAVIGVTSDGLAVYNTEAILEILETRDGMSPEEAEEFFSYDIDGTGFEDNGPVYVRLS
jgi:hypothetical protein